MNYHKGNPVGNKHPNERNKTSQNALLITTPFLDPKGNDHNLILSIFELSKNSAVMVLLLYTVVNYSYLLQSTLSSDYLNCKPTSKLCRVNFACHCEGGGR